MESPVKIDGKEEEEEDRNAPHPPPKRIRLGKVAEMVLVLAAMGKMRNGGVEPTDAEVGLMNEATEALAGVCEGFAPTQVFPKEAFGSLIDDLGLNRLKEEKPGSRPPKLSIAERMLDSKKKMEKADEFALQSNKQSSQHLQVNSASAVEGLNPSQMFQMPNSNQAGMFTSGTPFTHGITGTSISSPYQLPSSEIRPVISNALPSSHLVSSGLQRSGPQLRTDARLNGPSHAFPSQANYPSNASVRTPSWSMQTQPVQVGRIGSENKVPVAMTPKVQQGANVRTQMTFGAVNTQTNIAPPSQSTKQVHAMLASTHSEIGKIIQKLLQPRVLEHRKWVPPSKEYMKRAMTCPMCMSTVTEPDSVLICDACEKGYHLKCLQTTIQKLPAAVDWHCRKCLSLSNGRPIQPKYGRVTRNLSMSKMSSLNSEAVPATCSKNVCAPKQAGQPKPAANRSSSMQNIPNREATAGHQVPGTKLDAKRVLENDIILDRVGADNKLVEDAAKVQENSTVQSVVGADDKVSSGTSRSNLTKTSGSSCFSSISLPGDRVSEEKIVSNPNAPPKSDIDSNLSNHSLAALNNQDTEMVGLKSTKDLEMVSGSSNESLTVPKDQNGDLSQPEVEKATLNQSLEDHLMLGDSKESDGQEIPNNNSSLPEERVLHDNTSETASASGSMIQIESSSDVLHNVDWIGDPIQDSEEKIYYASCNINGHEYRAMDHVLIRFQSDKLVPSKIQAMWEDKVTKKKWLRVTRCYLPGDLPETVDRAYGLESNEVCESSCGSIVLAGLIESPCQVLSATNYAEEVERRGQRQGTQQNELLPPLYLCRWIYDEDKRLFRDISC